MAKIGLSEGFTLIPEGIHVFQITEVKYDEDFGKMEVTMKTASGQKHVERFSLLSKADGKPNEGAMNAFSYFVKTALNDYSLKELEDEQQLVGHYMRCEVVHDKVESNRNAGKMITFAHLGDKFPADGFDAVSEKPVEKKSSKIDLNSLLG